MNEKSFQDRFWVHPVILAFLLSATVVVVINLMFQRALPAEPSARMEIYNAVQMSEQAENELETLLKENPTNLELNSYYVDSYFDMLSGRERYRLETEMRRYEDLASKPETADIGNYALGLLKAKRYEPVEALEHYRLLRNPNQKYVSNAIGDVYFQLGRVEEAEVYFWQEIEMQGNVDEAVGNLAKLYMKFDRLEGLTELASDQRTAPYMPLDERRWLSLRRENYSTYFSQVYIEPLHSVRFEPVLSALLITLVWLIYLKRTGLFIQEPALVVLGGLVGGGLAALSAPLVSDLLRLIAAEWLHGSLPDSAWRIALETGIPSEFVKFVPVLILAALSRQVNEPIDLMVYGSLTALGFATLDNALQFEMGGGGSLFAGFLMNTVVQIALTGGVCYLWALASHIRPLQVESPWPGRLYSSAWILLGLVFGALFHGWYENNLLNPPSLTLPSVLIAILLAAVFGRMLRSALRHSPFFDPSLATARQMETYTLVLCFGIIFLTVSYLYDHFNFTTVVANSRLAATAVGSLFVIVIVFLALNELGLRDKSTKTPVEYD